MNNVGMVSEIEKRNTAERIASNEMVSGILWLAIAIIQILAVFTILAGLWNIFVGISKLSASKDIRRRAPDIPKRYEPIGGLVAIIIVNVLFGGLIGVLLVGFDFFIRNMILENRGIFEGDQYSTNNAAHSPLSPQQTGFAAAMPPVQSNQPMRAASQINDNLEQIERLHRLYQQGALSREEFDQEKSRLLRRG